MEQKEEEKKDFLIWRFNFQFQWKLKIVQCFLEVVSAGKYQRLHGKFLKKCVYCGETNMKKIYSSDKSC